MLARRHIVYYSLVLYHQEACTGKILRPFGILSNMALFSSFYWWALISVSTCKNYNRDQLMTRGKNMSSERYAAKKLLFTIYIPKLSCAYTHYTIHISKSIKLNHWVRKFGICWIVIERWPSLLYCAIWLKFTTYNFDYSYIVFQLSKIQFNTFFSITNRLSNFETSWSSKFSEFECAWNGMSSVIPASCPFEDLSDVLCCRCCCFKSFGSAKWGINVLQTHLRYASCDKC